MPIDHVELSSDAYMVCLAHALSTEKEEIMGLLIGEIDDKRVSHISAVIMLRRSDKQADRVEISPEQLSAASTRAEMLAKELDRPLRVIGWYHSHPHITVWPSHVDVRTQAMYQMMEEGFVGLIMSVFNEDKTTHINHIKMTCFQSLNQNLSGEPPHYVRQEVPVIILPQVHLGKACLESLVELPRILSEEEQEAYERTTLAMDLDLVSRMHNGAVFTKSICHILEVMSEPLLQTLEHRLEQNKSRLQELYKERERLRRETRQPK